MNDAPKPAPEPNTVASGKRTVLAWVAAIFVWLVVCPLMAFAAIPILFPLLNLSGDIGPAAFISVGFGIGMFIAYLAARKTWAFVRYPKIQTPEFRDLTLFVVKCGLVLAVVAVLAIFSSKIKSRFVSSDAYFEGIATVWSEKEDESSRKARLQLHFNECLPSREMGMGVSVDRDTGTVKDWVVYDKVYCGECKLPDNAFSPQVRNGSNRCRIVLNWTPSEDGFHSVTTEFTELRWLSGLESSVACLLGFGLISQGAFPYAVLLGRLTGFRAVGFLAIPLILQLVAYCYAFYGPKTVGLAAAKMMWLLLLHFLAFLVCFFVW